jgi:hypothetical protein
MSSNSNLSLIQATALASNVSNVTNHAINAVNKVDNNSLDLEALKTEVNNLTLKLQNLCGLLSQATIAGINDVSLNYNNL